jgi:2-(1,2-epoxy-1,2-dihydrophenyl)acetyl-CoA isomerase
MSLLIQKENGVCKITLNRPEIFNSFNREMALALQKALDACQEDPEIRCVLLTGAGKAFCAGQDLKEVVEPNDIDLEDIVNEHYNPIIIKIKELNTPVIAAVNGVAAGAGANIALCCDIVVASESAFFSQAFSKIGLIPDCGGTFILPRLVGWQKASALMMTGDRVMAEEAESMGMIYAWYPDAEFHGRVKQLSEKIASMPTRALDLTKKALNRSFFNNMIEKQLALEDEYQTIAGQTEDYREGVAAFLEKRKPVFTGK